MADEPTEEIITLACDEVGEELIVGHLNLLYIGSEIVRGVIMENDGTTVTIKVLSRAPIIDVDENGNPVQRDVLL